MTPDWTDALCAQADPEAWQAQEGGLYDPRALRICATCPLQVECAEYAIADPSLGGMWGGTTPRERGRIRNDRSRRAAA